MSVNCYLLPIGDEELAALLRTPSQVRDLVEQRSADVQDLGPHAVAIVVLTAESAKDPLTFLQTGAPGSLGGWVGKYAEAAGRVIECEVDMGYGPASYYRNEFLRQVAAKLEPIAPERFEAGCDLDLLEDNSVYPTGWHDEHRKAMLLEAFRRYRTCVVSAANTGRHLLVWSA